MTVLAAATDGIRSAIACDTRCTTRVVFSVAGKLHRWAHGVLGYAGPASYMRWRPTTERTPEEVIDAFLEWAQSRGHGHQDEDGHWVVPAGFLMIQPGRVYMLHGDGGVTEPEEGYAGMGSAEEIAFGALYAAQSLDVADMVRTAVDAAIAHEPMCGGWPVVEVMDASEGAGNDDADGAPDDDDAEGADEEDE